MIRLTGTLTCATPDDLALVTQHLPAHIAASRAEPGCLAFNVSQSGNPMVWQLDETFTDQAAFEAHQSRTRASLWFAASRHLARDFKIA